MNDSHLTNEETEIQGVAQEHLARKEDFQALTPDVCSFTTCSLSSQPAAE